MTKFSILVCVLSSCLTGSWSLAQDATHAMPPDEQRSDIDRARIESEKARVAARNRAGSRIPYQVQATPPPSSSMPPATIVPPPPALNLTPSSPSVIAPCDHGGCFDSSGNRYNGGTANTYLNNAGKPCVKTGSTLQCF